MLQGTSGKTANISVGGVGAARRGKGAGTEAAAAGSGARLDVISLALTDHVRCRRRGGEAYRRGAGGGAE